MNDPKLDVTKAQEPISYGRRLGMLAAERPDTTAIVFVPATGVERRITWRELEEASNRVARLLADHGVSDGDMVALGLHNSPEHFFVTYAVWKLGALPLPVRAALPERERDAILDLAAPAIVVSEWDSLSHPSLSLGDLGLADQYSAEPLLDRISNPGRALTSGGSTGRPKIIITPGPWSRVPGIGAGPMALLGVDPNRVQLTAGPLYHTMPFMNSHTGLFDGNQIVVIERFAAPQAVDLIERFRISVVALTPAMMRRIISVPDLAERDLSSIQLLLHGAGPCPPWLKRAWIDLLDPEPVVEVYSAAEGTGMTIITGREWLERPGSVGRPVLGKLKIRDEHQCELPPHEVGDIYMRPKGKSGSHSHTGFEYIGAPPAASTPDGFIHIGDVGWVDEDGYLYLADRRTDLIISGDANIFPAEVEAALSSHPTVADVAVIGLPDEEWGRRVHALIQPFDPANPPASVELDRHCRGQIAAYKCPKPTSSSPSYPAPTQARFAARNSRWSAARVESTE